jgi:hypothetical protein
VAPARGTDQGPARLKAGPIQCGRARSPYIQRGLRACPRPVPGPADRRPGRPGSALPRRAACPARATCTYGRMVSM